MCLYYRVRGREFEAVAHFKQNRIGWSSVSQVIGQPPRVGSFIQFFSPLDFNRPFLVFHAESYQWGVMH
jgi:hypothetical protein